MAVDEDFLFVNAFLDEDEGAPFRFEGALCIDGGLDGREVSAAVLGHYDPDDGRRGLQRRGEQQGREDEDKFTHKTKIAKIRIFNAEYLIL